MKRGRWFFGSAMLVGLAIGGLVAAALLIPSPVRNALDPGANVRWEHRPRFGPNESDVITDTHVGKMREELLAELGEPTREGPWPIGMPTDEKFNLHKGLRTMEWHWPSGHFLASVYPLDGRWVCFDSCWVPKGVVID
jgi:hypothetical protein